MQNLIQNKKVALEIEKWYRRFYTTASVEAPLAVISSQITLYTRFFI